jgi:tRNA A-37 threonylcarbamoyl transferase component Bud32/DNA-directed RNA polymerase specialized sigma24 family protein
MDRLTRLARVRLSAKLAARLDADDVVMSAYRSFFVGARDGRFSLKESGDLWRLLAEITIHKLCRAAAHHRARRRSIAMEVPAAEAAESRFGDLISRDPSPDDAAAVADELEAVLASLPSIGRRVLELRLRGESIDAIAEDIRRSTKTVRRWLVEAGQVLQARQEVNDDHSPPLQRRRRVPPLRSADDLIPVPRRAERPRLPRRLLKYDDYHLRKMIGAGAAGKVYLSSCRKTATDVAVKFLRKSFLRRPDVVSRFIDEATVLARLKHPGIIRLHGLGRARHGELFIVMDLILGGDLARRIAQGQIDLADAVRWTAEAADAIAYAHEQGVIHCDLKPSNLLLGVDGRLVVTDFGLALDEHTCRSSTLALAGTPAFMAPEQVSGSYGRIGRHTDLYGLGAVLYTLLTGQPPVTGRNAVDILASIVSGRTVTPPNHLRPDIPPMLTRICNNCLAKHPAGRIGQAGALARALRDPQALER